MHTTLNIDEDLLKDVMAVTGEKYKVRAIRRALESYVRHKRIEELRSMAGNVGVLDELEQLEELEKQEMRNLWTPF